MNFNRADRLVWKLRQCLGGKKEKSIHFVLLCFCLCAAGVENKRAESLAEALSGAQSLPPSVSS